MPYSLPVESLNFLEECKFEMKKSMSPEYHQASKESVAIYIFDPGGDLNSLQDVLLGVSTGILGLQHLLHESSQRKKSST